MVNDRINIYDFGELIKKNDDKWKNHIDRMENSGLSKLIKKYKPKGERGTQ